jgi:cyclopropane-fatty-acyl-phospholipid synthase
MAERVKGILGVGSSEGAIRDAGPAQSRRAGPLGRLCRNAILSRLSGIRQGRLEVRLPAGEARVLGDETSDLRATVEIHDESVFVRFLFGGDIAFGETYAEGLWSSPDLVSVIRVAVRNLPVFDTGGRIFPALSHVVERLRHALRRNSPQGSRANIRYHYDLGTDFYSLFLDSSLTYSCALFDPPESSLEDAQAAKLDAIASALSLAPGDRLIEIGSGWGSFAIHAARRYGCRVTTTTISQAQYDFVRDRLEREGLTGRVTLLLEDYRLLRGRFDKAVSIEMFEAVGLSYYDAYFSAVDRLLEPGGAFLLQTIWMNEGRFPRYRRQPDFIQRHVFPGSELASLAEIRASLARATSLSVEGVDQIGPHYERTLEAWRHRFLTRRDRARALGFPETFIRAWDYYLGYCQGGFAEGYIGDAQMLLRKGVRSPNAQAAGPRESPALAPQASRH